MTEIPNQTQPDPQTAPPVTREPDLDPYASTKKDKILSKIAQMEIKLVQDQKDLKSMRSAQADAMRSAIPMVKDVLAILKDIVEEM